MTVAQCLINGQPADAITITDRGLHYGDGLFETLAVRDGQCIWLDAHLQRLMEGARRLGIPFDALTLLQQELTRLAAGQAQAVIKVILTRGSGGRGYRPPSNATPTRIVLRYPWPDYPATHRQHGVSVRFCTTTLGMQPALAGLKHLNRLEQVLARAEWDDPQIAEGLMCNARNEVIEGTFSNIFWVKDDVLHTPDLSECGVDGIMRQQVLQLAQDRAVKVHIGRYPRDSVLSADGLFLTNSLIGIWPVRQLAQYTFNIHPLIHTFMKALNTI